MAKNRKTLKAIQRFLTKTYNVFKLLLLKLWAGIRSIWDRPLIVGALLLIAAVFLFNLIVQQTFKPYTNCAYLIVTKLGMSSLLCDGIPFPKIAGLSAVMDPPLELVRKLIAWSVVILFACLSAYLTYILNNLKAVIKLLTFNKEQWKSFMASLRTWLLIFVCFCLLFYYFVMR
jgi:hypothetical protein